MPTWPRISTVYCWLPAWPWKVSMKATRRLGYWCSKMSTPRASHRPLGLLLYRLAAYTWGVWGAGRACVGRGACAGMG